LEEGKTKKPLYVHMKDGSPMVFAGLWESWKSPEKDIVESCTILTTVSNKLIVPLHDRMPVILHPQEYDAWLNREMNDPEQLKHFYQPYPSELMEMYPASPLVNSTKNEGPDLIKHVKAEE
jgi:putative SOS response-associated peptidase YedK